MCIRDSLYSSVTAPAQASCANKHLALYIAAIREMKASKRIKAFAWADTRDLVANALTKLQDSGLCETAELLPALKIFDWKLKHPYQWDTVWCTEWKRSATSTLSQPYQTHTTYPTSHIGYLSGNLRYGIAPILDACFSIKAERPLALFQQPCLRLPFWSSRCFWTL